MLEPTMSRAVLDTKIQSFATASPVPAVVATGNPGCLMQIGGGLRAEGLPIQVAHPVELLDWSYQAGGVYG
jgi:glycolate oxidase iron-sulfur subunit